MTSIFTLTSSAAREAWGLFFEPLLTLFGERTLPATRVRRKDRIDEILAQHRSSAKVCSRANLVEGMGMIPVALALRNDAIYYENSDIQAGIELPFIEEVEYDDETATGHTIPGKVLRIRAHNHVFEFALTLAAARHWQASLPARRIARARAM